MTKQICLNRSVLDFMAEQLYPDSFVIEFGGGWSSRWFADRCGKLITVETDPKWRRTIESELAGADCDWTVVGDFSSLHGLTDQADLVLIDCREDLRMEATRTGFPLLMRGGWILFDDAQRERHAASIGWIMQSVGGPGHFLRWSPRDVEAARDRLTIAWQK